MTNITMVINPQQKKIFDAMSGISNEATISFMTDGIKINQLSAISMSSTFIQPSILGTYECKEQFETGVNMKDLASTLKQFNKNDERIKLEINTEIKSLKLSTTNKSFTLQLIDANPTKHEEPVTHYDSVVSVPYATFNGIVSDAVALGDYASIKTGWTNSIKVTAKGDVGELDSEYKKVKVLKNGNASVMFNIKLLKSALKKIDIEKDIKLYLKNGEPIKMIFEVSGTSIKYFIAPMVIE